MVFLSNILLIFWNFREKKTFWLLFFFSIEMKLIVSCIMFLLHWFQHRIYKHHFEENI